MLKELRRRTPERECNAVVFFCERQEVERSSGKEALRVMRELDDFIVYEKGKLAEAIRDFIDRSET